MGNETYQNRGWPRIKYTKQRQVFGKSVLSNQYVHYRLAELQTEVELLRALTYRLTAQVIFLIRFNVVNRAFSTSPVMMWQN